LFPCTDNLSALDALLKALTELDKICEAVEDGYLDSLREGKFERWDEKR
jgi:DNA-directed RNA polymerase I and III subunit RPAC2